LNLGFSGPTLNPEAIMRVQLTDQLWLIPGRRGGHYPHCNSLFIDAGARAMIDPGSDRKELRALAAEGVGTVLLSHFHSDHLRDLREFPQAAAYVHSSEREAVEHAEAMKRCVYFPEEVQDEIWMRRKDREVGGWGWPVAGTFTHGSEFRFGQVTLEVLHTPGHTGGHCCFWFPHEKILYAADIDLTPFGPWYGNASSDLAAFRGSIESLTSLAPEITVTGHERGVIRGEIREELRGFGRIIEDRHHRILEFLASARSQAEVVRQGFIYGSFFSEDNSLAGPEMRMIRHHLELAVREGQVIRPDGLFVRA
jgi:glyoxylase-like metal-dependent hydrolase (beta-lactamase superfamily II)